MGGPRTDRVKRVKPKGRPAAGRLVEPLLIAVGFLTILPTARNVTAERNARWAVACFPIVGAMIGLPLLGLAKLGADLPRLSVSVFAVVGLAVLSGGLHLDGLADTVDGFAAAHEDLGDPAKILEVMKDPFVGFFGILAVMVVLMLKVAMIEMIPTQRLAVAVLVVPVLGRFPLLIFIPFLNYVRSLGAASLFSRAGSGEFLVGGVLTATVALVGGAAAVAALAAVTGWGILLALYFTRRLGGYTGDVLGFTVETSEVVALLAVALTLRYI